MAHSLGGISALRLASELTDQLAGFVAIVSAVLIIYRAMVRLKRLPMCWQHGWVAIRRKSVISEYGDVEIQVSRDRLGLFDPVVVKKHQTNVTGIEEQVIDLHVV